MKNTTTTKKLKATRNQRMKLLRKTTTKTRLRSKYQKKNAEKTEKKEEVNTDDMFGDDEPKKEEKKSDDVNEMFETETGESQKELEARQARMKRALEQKRLKDLEKEKEGKKKETVIAKSLVVFDVKGWDEEQDLNEIAKKIFDDVQMDGLVWKTEYSTPIVCFTIKKLVIAAVIEDEKVSADDIVEKITEWEDIVQSVEIASFNKFS